jgi:hypothetical protein
MSVQIPNPHGTYEQVTDYTTGRNGNSMPIQYPRTIETWESNDALIAIGDWVGVVPATTTTPLRVEQLDVSDAFAATVCKGVAIDASTAAGKMIRVVVRGPVICNIGDTGTIVPGDVAIKHASTDGASAVTAIGSVGTSVVVGTVLGTYLSAEIGTTNTAMVDVGRM